MKTQNKFSTSLLSNWIVKMIAFMTAVFIVIAVRFLNVTDRVVTIPLQVTLPQDTEYVPISLIPDTIDVVISGHDDIIYLVDPSMIGAYADFSDVDSDGIARKSIRLVYQSDIYTEAGLNVEASPSTVRILFGTSGNK